MSFNSFIFILVFLPITCLIYWVLKNRNLEKSALWFLVLASLFFYGFNYFKALPILIITIVFNYVIASLILKGNRAKMFFAIGIVADILTLSFFKYVPLLNLECFSEVSAPGISFYTFCQMALLFECYRKNVTKISLGETAFLVTFFPKVMEGPIVRPQDVDYKEGSKKISAEDIMRAIILFTLGCFKKVIIADTLGGAVDYGFTNLSALHTAEALIVMLSYTLQLYFDFSGYCDMALAIASLFGFKLPINFNSPYKARNICDFWKGWHISLTKFFTRYLYIPMGGNRKGKARKYLNVFIVFFVSGLWHGAGVTFLIWGMMHGILYIITECVMDCKIYQKMLNSKVWTLLSTIFTFLYVNVAWVFFRAPSIKDAVHLFKDMAQCWFPRFNYGLAKCFNLDELWYVIKLLHLDKFNNSIYFLMIIILIVLMIVIFAAPTAYDLARKCKINWGTVLMTAVLFIWSALSFEGVATYIYTNF